MGVIQEFREFAIKGNMIDMAVGIIIGGAFQKVVSSLVEDVLMPPIGLLLGGVDFTYLAVTLKPASGDEPAVLLRYGAFLQSLVDFFIVAVAVFFLVKAVNALRRELEAEAAAKTAAKEAEKPQPPVEVQLLREIRDLLKAQASG